MLIIPIRYHSEGVQTAAISGLCSSGAIERAINPSNARWAAVPEGCRRCKQVRQKAAVCGGEILA